LELNLEPQGESARSLKLRSLLDVAYDGSTAFLLGLGDDQLRTWSIGPDGSTAFEYVPAQATWARFVKSSPPKTLFIDGFDELLWVHDQGASSQVSDFQIDLSGTTPASSIALDERMVVAAQLATTPISESSVPETVSLNILLVNDNGRETTVGTDRFFSCPFGYTAEYPDVCEFDSVPPVTFDDAVLTSDLFELDEEPWLAFIAAEMTRKLSRRIGRMLRDTSLLLQLCSGNHPGASASRSLSAQRLVEASDS
jgi:hypothetical protein